jgi:sigma-E factor negative regulatory protein RseC
MEARMLRHRGVVRAVDGEIALVAMETTGCSACGHGAGCGIGKMAAGRPATLLRLPAAGVQVGDVVTVGVPETRLAGSALLGYLFPAFAMLLGAWIGAALDGRDGATALGAAAGFLAALAIARASLHFLPGLLPSPRLLAHTTYSPLFAKEQDHD